MSILKADIGPWIRRALLVGTCAAVMFSAAYFGPQLLRRSVDYLRKPAPPPDTAHWLEHRAWYSGHMIDEDMGNLVGWHRHETVIASDVRIDLQEAEDFAFSWSVLISRHGLTTSFRLQPDGMAEFRTIPPSDWAVPGTWESEGEFVVLRFTLSLDQRIGLARTLRDVHFDDMPESYWLTDITGENQWLFELEQGGRVKSVKCRNLFPRRCRALVEYILRDIVLPRA